METEKIKKKLNVRDFNEILSKNISRISRDFLTMPIQLTRGNFQGQNKKVSNHVFVLNDEKVNSRRKVEFN